MPARLLGEHDFETRLYRLLDTEKLTQRPRHVDCNYVAFSAALSAIGGWQKNTPCFSGNNNPQPERAQ